MKHTYVTRAVDCGVFRDLVHAFEDDELPEHDRSELQSHLDACPSCARILEVEEGFARALRSGLAAAPEAPEGLGERIRSALEGEDVRGRSRGSFSYLLPAAWALAAAVLGAALLIPWLARPGAGEPQAIHVVRAAVVVDQECDRGGRSLQQQRGCREASHLNALRVFEGSYWEIAPSDAHARNLLTDPDQRGRHVLVEGDLYPALRTIRLTRLRESAAALL